MDTIQNEGLEASVKASLALADSATQVGDNVSDLVNDANYLTNNDIDIPDKVSDLTNDAGYLVEGDLPIPVMTKETFFALAEKRIRDNAGSGFAEWGKHYESSNHEAINEGMYDAPNTPNALILVRGSEYNPIGVSRSITPIVNANGVSHELDHIGIDSDANRCEISFPDAPDGTKTYDNATGDVIQHADSATAFAAETSTRKVITSRQDYVFLESWHEKISDKGEVYPLGNVQYGASSYKGITLLTRDDGYTRFGEWDTETTGKYAVWDDLSFEEKAIFLSDPDNNIYQDGDDLIQVRYRIRVIEGLGDDWEGTDQVNYRGDGYMCYKQGFYNNALVNPTGKKTTVSDISGPIGDVFDSIHTNSLNNRHLLGNGHYKARNTNDAHAHDGLCFAVPIALVQRRNQGAYHPALNPLGCKKWNRNDDVTSTHWYDGDGTGVLATSTAQCFHNSTHSGNPADIGYRSDTGYIGRDTRPDGKLYDAIYASDVDDLRMSSRRV